MFELYACEMGIEDVHDVGWFFMGFGVLIPLAFEF